MSRSALFDPLVVRGVRFPNRIAVSPMCMYSAGDDGVATPWHTVHLGSRAAGGAGAVFLEATAVSSAGRITDGDLGLWNDEQAEALGLVAHIISSAGSVPGIQLSHAGRKGGRTTPFAGYEPIPSARWGALLSPTSRPFRPGWDSPTPMDDDDIAEVTADFARSAERACAAGFRVVELHFAHGYLVHQFLSPLVNDRADRYGGTSANRRRFAEEIVVAVRAAIPDDVPLIVRLSVVDWAEGGLSIEDSIQISRGLKAAGADMIDCSSGAAVPGEEVPAAPGYHVGFARRIRDEAAVLTGVVGLITEPDHASGIVAEGSADLVFIGRSMLRDPYWARRAREELQSEAEPPIPLPYRRAVERMDRRTQW